MRMSITIQWAVFTRISSKRFPKSYRMLGKESMRDVTVTWYPTWSLTHATPMKSSPAFKQENKDRASEPRPQTKPRQSRSTRSRRITLQTQQLTNLTRVASPSSSNKSTTTSWNSSNSNARPVCKILARKSQTRIQVASHL